MAQGLAARSTVRRITMIAGFVVSLAFLLLAGWRLDWRGVGAAFERAQWWPFVPLAMACYLAGHVVRGVRCKFLVRNDARLSTLTASNIVVVGYAVNNLLPARLGEFARAGMLAERTGMPFAQAMTITVLERLLDGMVMVGLLAAAGLVVPVHGWVLQSVHVAAALFGAALMVVALCAFAPYQVLSATSRVLARVPALHDRVVPLVSQITRGFAALRSGRSLVVVLSLSVLVWLCEAGLFLCVMPCFGVAADYAQSVVVMSATNLGILVPSSPGFIGPFHFFCMRALGTFGVGEEIALGYAVVVHLAFYAPVTLWGVVAMAWYGVELGTVAALQRAGAPMQDLDSSMRLITPLVRSTHEPQASRLLRLICEAIVPEDAPAARDAIVDRVSAFVAGQNRALPWMLRVALKLGLAAFWFVVLLRYARPFGRLPAHKRRAVVRAWAWGRVGLARQLFRVLRSTALLAWHEDPEIQRADPAVVILPAPLEVQGE